jgi:hypothetical protein
MIKAILAFLILFGLFFGGIKLFQSMTGKEKFDVAKLLTYSLVCATLTISILILIVFLF